MTAAKDNAAAAARIARERALLEAGDLDLREGRFIEDAALDAWLDRWVAGATTDELLGCFERRGGD